MWGAVRQRTDAVHFGTILRKRLLSGTEWVATLNQKLKQLDPAKKKQETERPSLSNVQHNSRRRTSTGLLPRARRRGRRGRRGKLTRALVGGEQRT
eukprot:2616003-Rhodomonas_salina.1